MHRRLAAALLLSGVTLVATATPALALAHAELIASTPAEHASLAAAPERVELTFDEPVTLAQNPLEVVGPGNVTWRLGPPRIAGAVVSAPVTASGPAGRYTLVYRVVGGDGHPTGGSVEFTLAAATTPPAPAAAEPSRTEPAASDAGTLLWVWLTAGAILLAALVFVTLRVRRSGR